MFDFSGKKNSIMDILNQLNHSVEAMKPIMKKSDSKLSFDCKKIDPQVFIEVYQQKDSPTGKSMPKNNSPVTPSKSIMQPNIVSKTENDIPKMTNTRYNKIIKTMNEKTDSLEKQVETLRKRVTDLETLVSQLKEVNKKLKEETIMLTSQYKNMKDAIDNKEAQNISLHVRITKQEDELASKETTIRGINEQIDILKANIQSLQQTNSDIKKMFSDKCEEYDRLMKNYTMLEAQKTDNAVGINVLQGKYDELKEILSTKDNKITELNITISSINRSMNELVEKNDLTSAELMNKHDAVVALENKFNATSKILSEKIELVTTLSDNAAEIQRQLQATQTEMQQYKDRYNEVKISSDAKELMLMEVASKLSLVSYNLDEMTKKHDALVASNESAQKELKATKDELDTCKTNIENRTTVYNSLLEKYNTLEQTLAQKQSVFDVLQIRYDELKAVIDAKPV